MREMKDSGVAWIGEIPETWSINKMKYIGTYINGYAFKPDDWGNTGLPIIRIQDLTGSNNNPNYFNGNIDQKYYVENGDILVSWAATLDAFEWNKGEGWLNQHIFKAIPQKDIVSKPYYIWLLKVAMSYMNDDNKHGIMMQHITLPVFNNFSIAIPPLEDQQKIAAHLDRKCTQIDALISNAQQQIEKLKAYKQSVITETVTKGLDPDVKMKDSGVEWIGEIPEDWEVTKFGRICKVKSNLVHPENYPDYIQIAPDNIEKGSGKLLPCQTVKESGVISDNHLFYKGQIIYSKIRPILNKVTIAPFDGLCSADMYPIETTQNYRYVLYYMLSNLFLIQVKMVTENRVKMPKINQEEISQIMTVFPSVEGQNEIVTFLDKKCTQIDSLIAIKQQKIEKLQKYKKSLIYEYVTGKKEV